MSEKMFVKLRLDIAGNTNNNSSPSRWTIRCYMRQCLERCPTSCVVSSCLSARPLTPTPSPTSSTTRTRTATPPFIWQPLVDFRSVNYCYSCYSCDGSLVLCLPGSNFDCRNLYEVFSRVKHLVLVSYACIGGEMRRSEKEGEMRL